MAEHIRVTLPDGAWEQLQAAAQQRGQTPAGFATAAVVAEIHRCLHPSPRAASPNPVGDKLEYH